jgi:hypothetical protein
MPQRVEIRILDTRKREVGNRAAEPREDKSAGNYVLSARLQAPRQAGRYVIEARAIDVVMSETVP